MQSAEPEDVLVTPDVTPVTLNWYFPWLLPPNYCTFPTPGSTAEAAHRPFTNGQCCALCLQTQIVCGHLCAHQQIKAERGFCAHTLCSTACGSPSVPQTPPAHAVTAPVPRNLKQGKRFAAYCARHRSLLSGEQYEQKHPYFQSEQAENYPFKPLLETN